MAAVAPATGPWGVSAAAPRWNMELIAPVSVFHKRPSSDRSPWKLENAVFKWPMASKTWVDNAATLVVICSTTSAVARPRVQASSMATEQIVPIRSDIAWRTTSCTTWTMPDAMRRPSAMACAHWEAARTCSATPSAEVRIASTVSPAMSDRQVVVSSSNCAPAAPRDMATFSHVCAFASTCAASPARALNSSLNGHTHSSAQPRPIEMRVPMGSETADATSNPVNATPSAVPAQLPPWMASTRACPSSMMPRPSKPLRASWHSATSALPGFPLAPTAPPGESAALSASPPLTAGAP